MELLCLLTSVFCPYVPLGSLSEESQLIPWPLCTAGRDSTIQTTSANVGARLARVRYSQGRVKPRDGGSALLTAVPLWLPCGMCKKASLPHDMLCCREKITRDYHLFPVDAVSPPRLLLPETPAVPSSSLPRSFFLHVLQRNETFPLGSSACPNTARTVLDSEP